MDATSTLTPPAKLIRDNIFAKIVALEAGTVRAQASVAWDEIMSELSWISTAESGEGRVLWFQLADGKGVGIMGFGHAVAVSPGYFNTDGELRAYGFEGTEFVSLNIDEPEKLIARVIRRARKLEIGL